LVVDQAVGVQLPVVPFLPRAARGRAGRLISVFIPRLGNGLGSIPNTRSVAPEVHIVECVFGIDKVVGANPTGSLVIPGSHNGIAARC
jgi:hypothetical protein